MIITLMLGLLLVAIIFIVYSQLQVRHINRQLTKRLNENTHQPISLQLINKELNKLAINVNKCLKAEETLRLESVREEKRFKELISNISHDLRTPLTAIRGYQQLMGKEQLSPEQSHRLEIAQKHAESLNQLLDQFFEYSYVTSSEPNVKKKSFNFTNLVMESLAMSVSQFEQQNLEVAIENAPAIFVLADEEMCERIIQNLIRNSLQHAERSVTVALSTRQDAERNFAVLTFSNTVKHSTALDPQRMFDRFYTGEHANKKSTGLGLAIVKLLIEQMDGRTYATLQEDRLTIAVELPLIAEE